MAYFESVNHTLEPLNHQTKPWKYTFGGENMIFRNVIIVSIEYIENIIGNLLFLFISHYKHKKIENKTLS